MKVQASVKESAAAANCTPQGVVRVICSAEPRHKQRQVNLNCWIGLEIR